MLKQNEIAVFSRFLVNFEKVFFASSIMKNIVVSLSVPSFPSVERIPYF